MPFVGAVCLAIVAWASAASVLVLLAATFIKRRSESHGFSARGSAGRNSRNGQTGEKKIDFVWGGAYALVFLVAALLTICCAILLWGFLSGDNSIAYVVKNRSASSSNLSVLYKISGLWAGREGSLLFWAWLISLFNSVIGFRTLRKGSALDSAALFVSQLVLCIFVGVLVFAEGNSPFAALPAEYLDANGDLTGAAALWGMNTLLEHWAMAIHPPALFIGYAGLTIPFGYALAALIVNDSSKTWVLRCQRYALVSWLFLGIGIGLGSIWAYVVLGWGGYWGWDPVENASLLSWTIGVALLHSLTIYRQRGVFKRWAVMCACLTFAFVIVGTFISRSGIVQSVHAFEAHPVSLFLFGTLIVVSVLAGAIGLIIRRQSFAPDENVAEAESMFSKDIAYYLNNVIMLVCTILLAYMTIAQALPDWLPYGKQALPAVTYNAIARPIGILYCLIMAVCPLLGWGKTNIKAFGKNALIPGICALLLFVVLMVYFVNYLLPAYYATLLAGGSAAETLLQSGAAGYYFLLTVLGFLVASLLLFNSLFMLVRMLRSRVYKVSTIGGFLAHAAMGVILIGLIGSSMYVSERTGYMAYDEKTDRAGAPFSVKSYTLTYVSNTVEEQPNSGDVAYSVTFDVEKDGVYLGQVSPGVYQVQSTQQQKLVAAVISQPFEDLFVVYRGVNSEGAFSLDVRVNPLINFVWPGFGLLMLGTVIAALGRRNPRPTVSSQASTEPKATTDG